MSDSLSLHFSQPHRSTLPKGCHFRSVKIALQRQCLTRPKPTTTAHRNWGNLLLNWSLKQAQRMHCADIVCFGRKLRNETFEFSSSIRLRSLKFLRRIAESQRVRAIIQTDFRFAVRPIRLGHWAQLECEFHWMWFIAKRTRPTARPISELFNHSFSVRLTIGDCQLHFDTSLGIFWLWKLPLMTGEQTKLYF